MTWQNLFCLFVGIGLCVWVYFGLVVWPSEPDEGTDWDAPISSKHSVDEEPTDENDF